MLFINPKVLFYEYLNILEPYHETEWIEECKCVMISECLSDENDASIDIRIITVSTFNTTVQVNFINLLLDKIFKKI